MCEIIMSSNFLHFRVSYLHPLKTKKSEYVTRDFKKSYIDVPYQNINLSTIKANQLETTSFIVDKNDIMSDS